MLRSVVLTVSLVKVCPKLYLHIGKMTMHRVIHHSNKRLEKNEISFKIGPIT